MLFSFQDCIERYGNHYQIKKAIDAGLLHKIQPGVYSDMSNVSELDLVTFLYPHTVFTMNSAFYYHGLTDVIPEKYYLATEKGARAIRDDSIRQSFHRKDIFPVGTVTMLYRSTTIRIYDKERMLIELIRNKKALPFDYYKEVIESYRRMIQTLDIETLQEYILLFPKKDHIWEAIELEVL